VFGLYIYFSIGLAELFTVLDSLNIYIFLLYYSLSFLAMLFVMLLWTIPWQMLLKALSINMGIRRTFQYFLAGDFIDRIVPSPGVVGEFTRAYFVQRNTANGYGVIIAAGITNRIVNYGVVVGGLSVGLLYLLLTENVPPFASSLLVFVWLGALVLFAVLSFVSLKEKASETLVAGLVKLLNALRVKRNMQGFIDRTYNFLNRFHEGFKFYRANPYYLVVPILLNILAFILNFIVYVLVFYALGLFALPLDFFVVTYFLAGAIQDGLAAFSVGGLEILLTNIFVLYGVPLATSSVAAVVVRIITFYFPLVMGYACIQVIGAKRIVSSEGIKEAEEEAETEEAALKEGGFGQSFL
jgi:uncharacterized protein (TIRG00374 family)